jgi:hypothetical protein
LDIEEILMNETTKTKIRNIIMSETAYDCNTFKSKEGPENIVQFIRETINDLWIQNFNFEPANEYDERLKNNNYIHENIEKQDVWEGLLEAISKFTKCLTNFAKKCPGFNKFDEEDFSNMVHSASLSLYGFKNRHFVRNNDSFKILSNNILYSRKLMDRLFEKKLVDLIFLFYRRLNELNLTDCETALMYPFILVSCDSI